MAINLPPELREEVHAAAAPLREEAPWVSWVPAEKLHLTIKFIGERPPEVLPALCDALIAAAGRHTVMDLALGGVGAFPNFRRPHVVWLGVEPHPRLELLQHDVEVACERHGIEVEGRAFRPHLTLGRVQGRPTPEAARALAGARRGVTLRREMPVESVDLMRSELLAGGARHTVLAAAPLRTT